MEDMSNAAGWVAARAAVGQTLAYADKMDLATMTPFCICTARTANHPIRDNKLSMGILRLYLAICVVAVHASESVLPWGTHNGREAVQMFFIISGFYMQLILSGSKYESVWEFYRSRSLRIFIPYFISLALVAAASILTGLIFDKWLTLSATVNQFDESGNAGAGTVFATLTNGTLFFQDWVMFLKQTPDGWLAFTSNFRNSNNQLWHFLWIPQAWTVGVELTFYLTAPFLVRKLSLRALLMVAGVSLVSRLWSYRELGLTEDPWDYRFFPFELLHFCYGMIGCRLMQYYGSIFDRLSEIATRFENKFGHWYYPILVVAVLICLDVHRRLCAIVGNYAYHMSVADGTELAYLASLSLWCFLVPILFSITRHSRLDRAVGELSYPVYLIHFTICLLVQDYILHSDLPQWFQGETAAILSVAIAILLQIYVLNPFEVRRQKIVKMHASQ